MHDLAPTSRTFACDVCGHAAGRRNYLEKHLRRHRIVYVCCLCSRKFPSSCRLQGHLLEEHGNDEGFDMEDLFRRSVEVSLFLPEPDGSMDGWLNSDPTVGEDFGEFVEELGNSDNYVTDTTVAGCAESIRVGSAEVTSVSQTIVGKVGEMASMKYQDCAFANESLDVEDSVDGGNSGMTLEFARKEGIVVEINHKGKDNADGLSSNFVEITENGIDSVVSETGDQGRNRLEKVCLNIPKNDSLEQTSDAGSPFTTETPDEIWPQSESRPNDDLPNKSATEDESDMLIRLGFLRMNLTIFENIRNTFGSEECEFCGRLFASKSDSRLHRKVHTGRLCCIVFIIFLIY